MGTGKTLARAAVVEADRPWASSLILPQLEEKRGCSYDQNAWGHLEFCPIHSVARGLPREKTGINEEGGMAQ